MIDLAASAPDAGDPTIVPITYGISYVVFWGLGLVLGFRRQRRHQLAEDGAALFGIVALVTYVFGLVTGLY